ncbi:MAG: hypothetical protein ABW175_08655, partial [Bradyrhizobium sp.]
ERGAPAGTPPFVQNWQRDFDYLYLIGPSIPNPMPDRLEFVMGAAPICLISGPEIAAAACNRLPPQHFCGRKSIAMQHDIRQIVIGRED